MGLEIKNLIVHKLTKEVGGMPNIEYRSKGLPLNDTALHFVKNVNHIYYKKSNPTYGVFDSNELAFPFQTVLRKYLEGGINFIEMTSKAMELLKKEIKDLGSATGGYLLFGHFINNHSKEFFFTLMLNDTVNFQISNDLLLEEIQSLDLTKLDVANFVNISSMNDSDSESYLSFTRGRKDISNYFKSFIGVTKETSSKLSSQNFMKALLEFLDEEYKDDTEKIHKIRSRVREYCLSRTRDRYPINLDTVSEFVNPDDPGKFKDFASNEEYGVSYEFPGHRETLNLIKYYTYSSEAITLKIDRDFFEESVIFQNGKLTIKNLPKDLKEQLMSMTK